MSQEVNHLDSRNQSWDNRSLFTVFICTLIARGLRGLGWMSYLVGLLLAYYVVLLIGFWVGRRPVLAFRQFATRITAFLLIMLAGCWAIPALLSHWIWRPAAFAVPVLAAAISVYWVPPLYPDQGKRVRFWVWLLCSIAFAVLIGWVEHG
jgi:hypothetical protein